MDNVYLIVIGIFIISNVVMYFVYQHTAAKLSVSEMKNIEYERIVSDLKRENTKLREEMKIKSKNEEEANEKIDSLHNGDTVSNAINGLCKH